MISFYDILPVSKENDNKYMKNKNRETDWETKILHQSSWPNTFFFPVWLPSRVMAI